MGFEDRIREMEAAAEAAKAADADRARSEQTSDWARARQANEALDKLAQEALPSLQSRNKGLGLEIEPFKRRFGKYGIHVGRKIWLLPKTDFRGQGIVDVGFLADATPVWARPGIVPPGTRPDFPYRHHRENVLRKVREAGCVVPICSVSPIVALGTPPVYSGYDNVKAQQWGFYLNNDGRLTYGYQSDHSSTEVDVESYFARCIAEGIVDSDW